MKFHYEGIELATQQTVEGELEAVSEQEVVRTLDEQRIEALTVRLAETKRKRCLLYTSPSPRDRG